MIIGLHGKKRSGKDTVFGFIRDFYANARVERRAFADPLKLSAYRLFKPDATLEEALEWADAMKEDGYLDMIHAPGKGAHVTGREFLQRYGTEAHRDLFGTNFWVDASLPRWDGMGQIESTIFPGINVVVFTDVRFPNEAERVREWGGAIWEVSRPSVEVGDSHASEQRLPESLIDYTLYNIGSLEELESVVRLRLQLDMLIPNSQGV